MAFEYAIALTGSIATGKSTVARYLTKLGFDIIDADTISHTILNEEHETIAGLFGKHLVSDAQVDRKALGNIVFSDASKRKMLEELLHPRIYSRIESLSESLDKKKTPYFVDIPLFFESNRYPIQKVLVIYTPKKLQLQRLMQRDTMDASSAKKRIQMQIPIEEKRKKADYVIDNSGTLATLKHECVRVKDEILGEHE